MPSKPVRTLEEREAAYAEARLRILGSACSPEEESESSDADSSVVQESNKTSRSSDLARQLNAAITMPDNVIRQPRGPDGTKGFGGAR